ncbi:MAG: hypothetical protein P4L46_16945 [Fimbriimonas sp.]|nr:hypothetical protein [Fimbriimonas sp.]
MPIWLTGRKEELTQVSRALRPGRIVTLVGPGGVGKSTLARAVVERFRRAGFWADLALVDDLDLLRSTILYAFNASSLGDAATRVGQSRSLLVLDNCDGADPDWHKAIQEIRLTLPRISILATSRRRLGFREELTIPVNPLATESTPGLRVAPATDMLALRVSSARRGLWQPNAADMERLARLARITDGLPLALELIAARSQTLTLSELESVFANIEPGSTETSFGALSGVFRRSLVYLPTNERDALFRLTAFPDSWDEDAARALDVSRSELDGLVEASLVVALFEDDTIRYRLLDPIREAIQAELSDSSSVEEWRSRLALHFLERVQPQGVRPFRESPTDPFKIRKDLASYIQAQRWFGRRQMTEQCSIITIGLAITHLLQEPRSQSYEWIRAQLTQSEADHAAFGHVLCCGALAAMNMGEFDEAKAYLYRATTIAETQKSRFYGPAA